tara:strand:+ start:2410 stop:3813 length:1404 start_codon:yes stop_codon:yes gene_type:complete
VIEFVLLFALGFLAAALVALIVAPIIQRRVVSLTERRIRASVPLSVAEIRAEKDMARAAFAAENARLSIDLKHNRDLLTESVARGARLSNDLVALRAQKIEAENAVEERDASIRELNAELAERDVRITTLTGHFSDATRLAEARKQEMAKRDDQINRLGGEIEELRIDLVTLDTEAENFKSQIRELREERNVLRETLKDAEASNRDLELRLKSTNERLVQNEEKLAKTITMLTDRENALERRSAEVERFRQKNRELSDELRAAKKAPGTAAANTATDTAAGNASETTAQAAGTSPAPEGALPQSPKPRPELRAVETPAKAQPAPVEAPADAAEPVEIPVDAADDTPPAQPVQKSPAAPTPTPAVAAVPRDTPASGEDVTDDEKIDRLRARQAALVERLLKADKNKNDAALRREIATIAAMMVELTASREGKQSRIHTVLRGNEDPTLPGTDQPSLATRARDLIAAGH